MSGLDIKQGDLVLLKTQNELEIEFGDYYYGTTGAVREMDRYLGGIYEIARFVSPVEFKLKGLYETNGSYQWNWRANMVKAISRKLVT